MKSPESGLVPLDPQGQAEVAQWQGFVDFSILSNLYVFSPSSTVRHGLTSRCFSQRIFVYGTIGGHYKDVGPLTLQARYNAAVDNLRKLDVVLARKAAEKKPAFLVGDKVTLADIAVVSGLVRGYQGLYDAYGLLHPVLCDLIPTNVVFFLSSCIARSKQDTLTLLSTPRTFLRSQK